MDRVAQELRKYLGSEGNIEDSVPRTLALDHDQAQGHMMESDPTDKAANVDMYLCKKRCISSLHRSLVVPSYVSLKQVGATSH